MGRIEKQKRELIEEANKRILNERRQPVFNYLKEKLPWDEDTKEGTPEYVVFDWFYKSNKDGNKENIKGIIEKYSGATWELKENFPISLNILSDETIKRLKERWGGKEKKGLVGDLERHQTQSKLIKINGNKVITPIEPIILLELLDGKYELVEGWHRTIQIFKLLSAGIITIENIVVPQLKLIKEWMQSEFGEKYEPDMKLVSSHLTDDEEVVDLDAEEGDDLTDGGDLTDGDDFALDVSDWDDGDIEKLKEYLKSQSIKFKEKKKIKFLTQPLEFEYPKVWIGKSTDGTDISIYK